MNEDTDRLVERWILAFCEPPPLIDAELMRRMLAENDAKERAG
ncbi:hypothetical protein [Brevundimonas fluminis]|jgi:hypothetical protein|nr:hypothetical protein [Brevundimonas fluminis]